MNPSQHLLDELRTHVPRGVTSAQLEDWIARNTERVTALLGQRGRVYAIAGNWYIDTLALERLAEAHEVVPVQEGAWNVLIDGGILHARPVAGLPQLPGQRGQVFRVRPRGNLNFPAALHQTITQGTTALVGTWNAWPNVVQSEKPVACSGKSCGCGPCQGKTRSQP
jgi:hypothetical protein